MDEQQGHDAPGENSKSNGAAEDATVAEVIPMQPEGATQEDGSHDDATAPEVEVEVEPSLEEKLEDATKAAAASRDRMLRVAADFDNYRKRAARDIEDARKRGRQHAIKEMLPVFDNLERALAHGDVSAADAAGMIDGMRMVHRQFVSAISKLGMERVEALGKTFDPALHDSIQHLHSDEYDAGQVMAMLQPGYRMGDMLVRPAMVVVSKGPEAPKETTAEETTAEETTAEETSPQATDADAAEPNEQRDDNAQQDSGAAVTAPDETPAES